MIPAQPIPINGRGNNQLMAGSAFLVSGNDKVWLVTCVHNVSGMKDTPISAFDPLSSIEVVGTNVAITRIGSRNPNVVRLNNTPILVDCMSIQLTPIEASALGSFGSFHLSDVVPAIPNSDVIYRGFPGMTTQPIPASSTQDRVSRVVGISIELNGPSAPGYSGCPLYTEDGLIGVVHGDIGVAPNYARCLAIGLYDIVGFIFP